MADDPRIDALARDAVELLRQLVSFDSVSRNSNLAIIGFIQSYLEKLGAVCVRVPSEDGTKSNLLARFGPEAAGGVILSGHTDVVPVDGQDWNTDPFTLTERGGKLYGRGTSDMKSFIALCLALAPSLSGKALGKPVWMAFSYDEEIGCLGAPLLLEHITAHIPLPAYAIIGEPTQMEVVTAHKGVLSFETTVRGLEWHSSQPQLGVNAVQAACDLVTFLGHMAAETESSGVKDERFSPPHSTVHVGLIRGGTARNIIPRECSFQWEIRPLPADNPQVLIDCFTQYCDEMRRDLRKRYSEADITTVPISHMLGVTLPASAQSSCAEVMRYAQSNREQAVSFGTEAGIFNDYGVPAIICGPGSIEQAHKPNEFIESSQIRAGAAFMLRFADALTGGADLPMS